MYRQKCPCHYFSIQSLICGVHMSSSPTRHPPPSSFNSEGPVQHRRRPLAHRLQPHWSLLMDSSIPFLLHLLPSSLLYGAPLLATGSPASHAVLLHAAPWLLCADLRRVCDDENVSTGGHTWTQQPRGRGDAAAGTRVGELESSDGEPTARLSY